MTALNFIFANSLIWRDNFFGRFRMTFSKLEFKSRA